jgi:cysteinyl-tRNA synthetase
MESLSVLEKLSPSASSSVDIAGLEEKCYAAMNDDFNSPVLIAHLFDGVRIINSVNDGKETLTASDLETLRKLMHSFVFEVLGLCDESKSMGGSGVIEGLMKLIIDIRKSARENKDWNTSDKIRDELNAIGVEIKDAKEGVEWRM